MKGEPTRIFPCPTCGKPSILGKENPWRPFCSERCKLIDLGEWAAEEHKIPGEPAITDLDDQEDQ
ncbi:DNA gyrase inhibitor YacG [Marinospirillum alkaliphilum]|uniref:DNA gyrase inhibitor YacG n=1 Tax=Marinospirillum alkaliphilum DSM 21637 TaxID=1122209 RepID=A0A1K1TSL5_9GAMM|nr:DNA gyrase inhibitor YacG [Marinospirillum alkaliphilum]SFX03534.1 hypothetical protein SAMN02745752_00294 [Marinospirillum alkaliphilum DSM 21637]